MTPDQFGAWLGHQACALDGNEHLLQRVGEPQFSEPVGAAIGRFAASIRPKPSPTLASTLRRK